MVHDQRTKEAMEFWRDGLRNREVIKAFFYEPLLAPVPLEPEEVRSGLQNAIELCRSYKKGVEDYLAVHSGEMEKEDAGMEYVVIESQVRRELERNELELDLDDESIMERARKGKALCERLENTFQEWSDAGELPISGFQYNWLCMFIECGPFDVAQTDEEAAQASSMWQQEVI